MRRQHLALLGLACVAAAVAPPPATAQQLFGTEIRADCSVATTGDIADSVINIVCGMPHADVVEIVRLTASSAPGDRAELVARLDELMPATSRLRIEAVARFFAILGETEVPAEQLADRFADLAERHRRLIEEARTLRVADPEVQALRDEAVDALDIGEHDAARALLDEARAIVRAKREMLARILADQQREEAMLVAEQARIESARLGYREAAALYREAASLLPESDVADRWSHLVWAALALYDQGREFGDNPALHDAITTYEQVLALAPRAQRPDDWAMTQNNLGNALQTLGGRESGTATLERAVAAYEAALLERTRERVPLAWAYSRHGLAYTLEALAERTDDPAILRAAITAMTDAAEIYVAGKVDYWLPVAEQSLARMRAQLAEMTKQPG